MPGSYTQMSAGTKLLMEMRGVKPGETMGNCRVGAHSPVRADSCHAKMQIQMPELLIFQESLEIWI